MQTAEQLRAARAMLQLDQSQVAGGSGVSVETIKRLEKLKGDLQAQSDTIQKVRKFFQDQGVIFGGRFGPSVTLVSGRKPRMLEAFRPAMEYVLALSIVEYLDGIENLDAEPFAVDFGQVFDGVVEVLESKRDEALERIVAVWADPYQESRPRPRRY